MSTRSDCAALRRCSPLALALSALLVVGGSWPALAMMALPASPQTRQLVSMAASRESSLDYLKGCVGFECIEGYIDAPDDAFEWHEQPAKQLSGTSSRGVHWTGHVLEMTSQRWLGPKDTSHQLWTHPMLIVLPDGWNASSSKARTFASVFVGGAGQTFDSFAEGFHPADQDVRSVVELATRTGAPAALVSLVPNQAITFGDDPAHAEMIEDQIKARTWRHLRDHPADLRWPIEMPDAKASVRAMDTVAAFLGGDNVRFGVSGDQVRFGISGCSKRAVAAIMACAHDSRCELLMPCAMTANLPAHETKAGKSYGGRPFAAIDYVNNHIEFNDQELLERVMPIVDPLGAVPKLTMPKLWLGTSSDDFFLPDHTEVFWKDLPEPKYLFMRPNARHAASIADATGGDGLIAPVAAFVSAHLTGEPLPRLEWRFNASVGDLLVRQLGGRAPLGATVWRAGSCGASARRDFRLVTADQGEACSACGQAVPGPGGMTLCNISRSTTWSSRPLQPSSEGLWQVHEPEPDAGWAAFFVSFDFASPTPNGDPLQLTTEIFVVPYDKYPFLEGSDKLV